MAGRERGGVNKQEKSQNDGARACGEGRETAGRFDFYEQNHSGSRVENK